MEKQEIFNLMDLFTSQSIINFYENIFDSIDLSFIPEFIPSKYGPKGYSQHALIRSFIVMKLQAIKEITTLRDYLYLNLKIAHLCGFDITKSLPSYSVFQRFIKNFNNKIIKQIMNNQVKQCLNLEILNSEITCVDSTPIKANTKFNNPKCFSNNKFKSSNQPKSDLDCKLGIHSANNQDTHKKHQFYWGYKSLIICDAKSGLPIYEETCTADKSDFSSFIGFMKRANKSFSLVNSIVIADKGFDSKKNYNYIKNDLNGTAIIAKNKRNTKNSKSLAEGNLICQAGLAMHKDGKQYLKDSIKQKYRCPFAQSKDDSLCPCGHPRYFNNAIKRGCIKYKNIGTDYRSSVDETSMYFKNLYSKRTECERHNARLKNLNLEYVSVRNFDSVQNLYTLGHICLLSVAIAAKKQNLDSLMKSLVKFKRAL